MRSADAYLPYRRTLPPTGGKMPLPQPRHEKGRENDYVLAAVKNSIQFLFCLRTVAGWHFDHAPLPLPFPLPRPRPSPEPLQVPCH